MRSTASSPKEYVAALPDERRAVIEKLRRVLKKNLPKGFVETVSYGMLGYVVPHSLYPAGYHAKPGTPLPFINLASQKNAISLYHMALYEGPLLVWFREEWARVSTRKLDMGKCCVRFKKPDEIPFELVGQLATKITPDEWIAIYERNVRR